MDYLQIARDLISIDSTTGREKAVALYLEEILRRDLGQEVRRQEVEPDRWNVVAGPDRPAVLFCTHLDTVPPFIPLREDEEHLHGRGACDTKGITACFLEAARRLRGGGVDDVGFLFVVGEEVNNIGARVANGSVRARYVIVGEPTENRLATGHKGALGVHIRVRGKAAHSAYPERGDSAVHRLLEGLSRVMRADFGRSDRLGPATVNIGQIRGGVAHNVLAAEAEARVLIRVVGPLDGPEKKLRDCFAARGQSGLDPRVELETTLRMPTPRLERLEGFEETIVSYGTDVPFLTSVGRPLLFGPGSILDAHTDGEKISKREMERAVDAYVEMARRLIERGA